MNISVMIKDTIEKLFRDYSGSIPTIAIYPFGEAGLLTKYQLNNQFGINEKYLVDNNLCQYNSNIISSEDLINLNEDLIVIISIINPSINAQLCRQMIDSGNNHIKIANIIDPLINPVEDHLEYYRELISLLRIKKCVGGRYLRVGRRNDGGYAMLDDFADDMKAYSFGIGDDMSWDMQINDMSGMSVEMFDHTIPFEPRFHKGCNFHKIGIGVNDDKAHSMISMGTIMEEYGDNGTALNSIMKMDIEGAEWDVLETVSKEILTEFRQILIEFHGMTNEDKSTFERRLSVLRKLNSTHQLVWVHGNNYTEGVSYDGMVIPNTIEVLYLNRKCYNFADADTTLPLSIDMPNMDGRKDFDLSYLSRK